MSRRRYLYLVPAGIVVVAIVTAFLLAPTTSNSARSASPGSDNAVTLEEIPGTDVKRINLSKRAAERLDIQTDLVSEEVVARTLMVSGQVVNPTEVHVPRRGDGVAISVKLSPGEWKELAPDVPARILHLTGKDESEDPILAVPATSQPREDAASSMLEVLYVVRGNASDLVAGERVRVELRMSGSSDKKRVVPYDAVYYDSVGTAWVYVNTSPLVFERRRIVVERVTGDRAVLSDGPDVGTPVVVVGSALLYGTEIFGK